MIIYTPVSGTIYGTVRNATAQLWNGSSFVALSAGPYSSLIRTATQTGQNFYSLDEVPGGLIYVLHVQIGSQPLPNDPVVAITEYDITQQGTGPILVDHNYGGTDNLRITQPNAQNPLAPVPVANADIAVYRANEFAANRQTARPRGQSETDDEGRWILPMRLFPYSYTLVVMKTGFLLREVPLVVTE
jgi:hypothetical protein